ncbi:hypothetical protein ACLB2K_016416 [Fragaria x ananassa]
MDSWKRKQLHSHVYRVPEPFRDEVVVVVGTSQSGQDISVELVQEAKAVVYLSARSLSNIFEGLSKVISKHDNLHLCPQIECLQEDGKLLLVDGSPTLSSTAQVLRQYADYTGFPHLEEWKKKIFFITLNNYYTNLETYRDSLDDDDLIKEALQSPHFIEQEEDAQVSPL